MSVLKLLTGIVHTCTYTKYKTRKLWMNALTDAVESEECDISWDVYVMCTYDAVRSCEVLQRSTAGLKCGFSLAGPHQIQIHLQGFRMKQPADSFRIIILHHWIVKDALQHTNIPAPMKIHTVCIIYIKDYFLCVIEYSITGFLNTNRVPPNLTPLVTPGTAPRGK